MQYCEHCKVHIRGNRKYCPLCQNTLKGAGTEEEEVFPDIPAAYEYHMIFRIMIFISICIIIISLAIKVSFPVNINWPFFVIFSIGCIWLSLALVVRRRHNIPKSIIWQVAVISFISVLWDLITGWKGWSFDFVIPTACVLAMIVMYVSAKVLRLGVRDFIVYILLDSIFGIVPVLFFLFNAIHVKYPSIISITVSAISLIAVILFEGENIKEELNKRMHI